MTTQAPQDSVYLTAIGTVASDVVIAQTKKNQDYARVTVKAEVMKETFWLSVIAFDAAIVESLRRVHKDARVDVAGRLQVRTWTGNDGKERTSIGLVASTFSLLTGARTAQADPYEDAPFFGMVGAMP